MIQPAIDLAQEILANPEMLEENSTARGTSPEALATEEHLAMLRNLTRMSMNIASYLHDQVMAVAAVKPATPEQSTLPDPAVIAAALAFSRTAKTVRQCMALEERFRDNHTKRSLAEIDAVGEMLGKSRDAMQAEARRQIKRAVTETIEAELDANVIERPKAERLLADLNDRLDDELLIDDLDNHPLGACIAKLCKRLKVSPDWTSWKDTAWAAEEIALKPAGSPYARKDWKKPVERVPRQEDLRPYSQYGLHRR
jgi:hypothetical protein